MFFEENFFSIVILFSSYFCKCRSFNQGERCRWFGLANHLRLSNLDVVSFLCLAPLPRFFLLSLCKKLFSLKLFQNYLEIFENTELYTVVSKLAWGLIDWDSFANCNWHKLRSPKETCFSPSQLCKDFEQYMLSPNTSWYNWIFYAAISILSTMQSVWHFGTDLYPRYTYVLLTNPNPFFSVFFQSFFSLLPVLFEEYFHHSSRIKSL